MHKVILDSMEYVEVDNVNTCPYCGSEEIEAVISSFGSHELCLNCDREYQIWEV